MKLKYFVGACLFMEGLFLKFNNFSGDKIIEEVLVCVLFLVLKWCNECWREAVVQKMIYRWQAWAARFIMIVLAKYCLHWPVSQCLENHTIPIWLSEIIQYLIYPKMKGWKKFVERSKVNSIIIHLLEILSMSKLMTPTII